MTSVLPLPGLTPTPLASYLSAIGLFRVVAEQLDRTVRGSWRGDRFVLHGLDADALVRFLVDDYVPSPVFSPWNKEGDPAQNETTRKQLDQLVAAVSPRLDPYRRTLDTWHAIAATDEWTSGDKAHRLRIWRSAAPDDALGWMDAAVALAEEEPSFPPLLGSGGNDGRFEFSRLLHGELIRLFVPDKAPAKQLAASEGWLRSLLFAEPGPALVESTSGMYDSDAAGTANSAAQGSAKSASNPWSIVLAFEGLIAFSSGVASRQGVGRRQFVGAPFTVRASLLGGDSAPGEDARGELWAPLWDRPARWPEVRRTMAEGRLGWQQQQAATTVDAARAVAALGVDRGITTFVRHQIVQRNGKSYIATPVGRLKVRAVKGVGELGAIDSWVWRVRGAGGAGVAAAVRRLDQAQLAVPAAGDLAVAYQDVLIALVDLERAVGRSIAGREKAGPFPRRGGGRPMLDAQTWVGLLSSDGASVSTELRLAVSVASLRSSKSDMPFPSMALALRGLTVGAKGIAWPESGDQRDAHAREAASAGDQALVEVLRRRLLAASQVAGTDADPTAPVGYSAGVWASLGAVSSLLAGHTDVSPASRMGPRVRQCDGTGSGLSASAWG